MTASLVCIGGRCSFVAGVYKRTICTASAAIFHRRAASIMDECHLHCESEFSGGVSSDCHLSYSYDYHDYTQERLGLLVRS